MKLLLFAFGFGLVFSLVPAVFASGQSWNSLLNAEDIFPLHLNSIEDQSLATSSSVINQLKSLLADDAILSKIYANYQNRFPHPFPKPNRNHAESMAAFAKKLIAIATHNIEYKNGRSTWEKGVNYFSDFTDDEISAQFGRGVIVPTTNVNTSSVDPTACSSTDPSICSNVKAPASLDWRQNKIVTPVKHQGQCGSCWAFGTLGMLEAAVAKKTKKLLDLSEQELVDCTSSTRDGCQGQSLDAALDYIKANGVGLEKDYPYKAKYGSCEAQGKQRAAKVVSWGRANGVNKVVDLVSKYGPVGVVVWISKEWYDYKGGLYQGGCDGLGPHAVDIVAYDSSTWTFKNSWGESWGEKGYMRFPKGSNKCQCEDYIYYVSQVS